MDIEFDVTEPQDQAVDNAPVRVLKHGNLTLEGYSRGAVQSYWRVPELKLGFDLGAHPWSFTGTPNWFVSHFHLDHAAALPVYVARRRMMKMAPPALYMPAPLVSGAERLLRVWQQLDRGRMPCELHGLEPGQEVELSRELVVGCLPTQHTVPSLGFVVYDRRQKLRPEFAHMSGDQIRDIRLGGTEVTEEKRTPLVVYLGDTAPPALDRSPVIYEAKVLILEVTFVAPGHRTEKIHKFGHTHLDDLLARSDRFQNELIIAAHLSTRYHARQAQQIVDRALPPTLRDRLVLWL